MYGAGLMKGLWVTLKNLFRGPITLKYPDEKLELPERSRWAVAPKRWEDGTPKCTACLSCVRECPDNVLAMQVSTREDKTKHIDSFTWEAGACMFCGLCVQACPFDALHMTKEYELAVRRTDGLKRTLLEDVDAFSPRKERPAPGAEKCESVSEPCPPMERLKEAPGD